MRRLIKARRCGGLAAVLWGAVLWGLFGCAATGAQHPFAATSGYHAIGSSVYGYLERDLNGDGLQDVVLARRDAKGYRISVMERQDPAGEKWSEVCATDPIVGEDMAQLAWLGAPEHALAMLVVLEENPEECMERFVVVDPRHKCNVLWADDLLVPSRESPVMRASTAPPEGITWDAVGNTLRLVDRTELVGLQASEGPVGLLAKYRERVGVVSDGHLEVHEATRAVLRKKTATIAWHAAADANAVAAPPAPVPALLDGSDDTAFVVKAGESGSLTISSDELVVLVELHHGCDVSDKAGLALSHSGQPYVTGTAPTDHAPFRAAGRRHPREAGYTQELLALRDPVNHMTFDLAAVANERCLREVTVYGW